MEAKSDEELVREIQDGNILSFETLVRRYQSRIIFFARRYVRSEDLAEEVAQDSFYKVYRAIDRVDPKRKFSTYLFEIAKNTAISYLRKTKQELPLSEELAALETDSVAEKIDVQMALASLPKEDKKVVELYYFSGLSYEEIARQLKIPINTMRTKLRRAREKLRKKL